MNTVNALSTHNIFINIFKHRSKDLSNREEKGK